MADSPSELQFEIEKLERKHAENPEGRFFVPLANAYRKMGDVETAEALLRSGIERHPDYLSAHIVLGRCLADRDAIGEAEEEFRFVLSQDPQNLIALRTLGELAVAGGRPSEAADWYRELLAVDPMNEDARQALDALRDAPSAAEEAEFRSGAGWWDPTPGADSDAEGAGDEEAAASGWSVDPEVQAHAEGDGADRGAVADPEQPGDAQDEGAAAAALYGWDDLPGLRGEEVAGEGAEDSAGGLELDGVEPEMLDLEELPGIRADEVRAEVKADIEAEAPAERWGTRQTTPSRWSADSQPGWDVPGQETPEPVAFHDADNPAERDDDDEGAAYAPLGSSEVVTETIAELYARQGLHDRAVAVYRELIRRRGGDEALERRLAEIERLAREEAGEAAAPAAAASSAEELTLADDEARQTPALDASAEAGAPEVEEEAEEDSFASSVAEGFVTLDEEWGGATDAEGDISWVETAAVAASDEEVWDEHPLPELAPEPATADESQTAPAPSAPEPGHSSIAELLRGLAGWRRGAGSEAEGESPAAATGLDAEAGVEGPATVYATAAPWDVPVEDVDGEATELPYLEEVPDDDAAAGTGPADDEPFPWELPGGSAEPSSEEYDRAPASELDPYFVDDVEPAGMTASDPLPESAPLPDPEGRLETEARAADPDPSEDEDLESFQAWLRSLKR